MDVSNETISNQASNQLEQLTDEIMHLWEKRAIDEVTAALARNSLALRDALPEFLSQIVGALNTTAARGDVRVKADRKESSRVCKIHGSDRAANPAYTMDQVIFEYHILRQVICDVMEQKNPLSPVEREVIVCAVEQAVNDAATQFSETVRDIQERYTYTLAHDLRGPLGAAKLGAQLILDNPQDSSKCAVIARRILSSIGRMDLMIHDLLDGSRLRAGEKLGFEFDDCNLNGIVQQAIDEADFSQLGRISFKPTEAVIGYWNEEALRRVFQNLITNALKFSAKGRSVAIDVKKHEQSVCLTVHNWGDPIPENERSLLFSHFQRARNAGGKSGWGLGLTIVKGITEAHGGTVEVQSSAETGTAFKIHLPLDSRKVRLSQKAPIS
jgi:signal transduction histidine kinase